MLNYSWHIFLVAVAGWINRQQQEVIEYLKEENRVLRETLGPGRVLLSVSQKRRLGSAAFKLGRKLLSESATFFSPDTLLKWHRVFVARKYDGSGRRGPKAKKANEVRSLVLRMKAENPDWGYSERFVQTVKNECTDKMIFLGQRHLEHVLSEFVEHYHFERPHQGLGNQRIVHSQAAVPTKGRLLCRERLGGLLKSYYRKAA